MINSVRARLTFWCVGVYGLLLLVFSIGVYTLAARALVQRANVTLRSFADAAEISLKRETAEGETIDQAARSTVEELNVLPEQAISIFTDDGTLLARRGSIALPFAGEPPADRPDQRMLVRRPALNDRHYVVVASQTGSDIDADLEVLRQVLYAAVPAAMALAAIAAWFLVRKSLTPLAIMSNQAQRIGANNLDERLVVPNPRDELGRLASSFNELLGRLNAAFSQQRRFMADASHELRTPLSVISTAAEVTLTREQRPESDYREALSIVGHETRRLGQIVNDMFTLAQVDAEHDVMHPAPLYLEETITESVHAVRVLASQKDVAVHVTGLTEAPYSGDDALLRRMLLNLLDNAVRHTPSGASVCLVLERTASDYVITVRDHGAGIPVNARPHIFERFYQVDIARSYAHTGTGAGLGLPIARWVAEAHGGSLALEHSDQTGSIFVVRLPRHDAPA